MSHHYSGPNWGFPYGDARLDLADLYVFPKPGDADKSILIMNVHPSVRDFLDGDPQRNDRERMSDAPTDPDQGRAINRSLPGDDSGNRDDVIWISGVANSENKTNCDDGDYAKHVSLRTRLTFARMVRTPMRQPLRQRGPGRRCHR